MVRSGLECNVEEVFSKFMDLTAAEMNKAVKSALRTGAKQLQGVTKSNMTSAMQKRNNDHWYDGKMIFYNDKIEDAVMISKVEGGFEDELSQRVHIMGTQKSGSGTFRARFLEKGTKERYAKTWKGNTLKKPRRLGSITGKWFFKNAQNQVFPNLPNIYLAEIEKTINKLNNTKL